MFGGKAPVALRPPPFRQGRLPCLVPGSRPIRDRAGSARKPRAGLHRPETAPVRATSSANGKAPRKRRLRREALERREACFAQPLVGTGSVGSPRTEETRVWKECVSTVRSGWLQAAHVKDTN